MATKKTTKKKKTKAARAKELSKIKKLLKKEEYRAQAIELLVALDDPEHWKAVNAMVDIPVDKHGFARVGNSDMHLLSQMPDDLEGVDEKKRLAERLRLQAGSVLIASAVPYVRKISIQGRRGTPWAGLGELGKLEHLEDLELWYLPLGNGDVLGSLERLKRLLVARNDALQIPTMPSVEELRLEQLGSPTIGAMPKVRDVRIATSAGLVDWTGLGASDALEKVEVIGDSRIANLDAIGHAVQRGAPLREVLLSKCTELVSLEGLRGAEQLETFRVRGAEKLVDVTPLSSATSLKTLELRECGIGDVSSLAALKNLEVLDLTGCPNATGIEALGDHESLRVLALGGTTFTREDVGGMLRWSTWASNPHIPSLASRVR